MTILKLRHPYTTGTLVSELKKTIYGNGMNGLKTAVTTHSQQIEQLVWWNRATIAASLSAIAAVLVANFR